MVERMEEGKWAVRERDGLLSSDDVFSALRKRLPQQFLASGSALLLRTLEVHFVEHDGKKDEEAEEGAISGRNLG